MDHGNDCPLRLSFENETGTGQILAYEVFPGILLSYSNFHLERCESNYTQSHNMFGFEYCIEGKIQWNTQDGQSAFLGAGSFMPYDYGKSGGQFIFPQRNYQGISFGIQLPISEGQLPPDFPVDLNRLKDRFCMGNSLDLSASPQAANVLGLLQASVRQTDLHRKLACLELLLFLQDLQWKEFLAEPVYLPSAQVRKLKQAAEMILNNLEHPYTLQDISKAVGIPVTTLRRHFTSIYGCSVAKFARKHRVEQAQQLLRETELSISQIASMVGYDNPSKFASMFRSFTSTTPQAYRQESRGQNGV